MATGAPVLYGKVKFGTTTYAEYGVRYTLDFNESMTISEQEGFFYDQIIVPETIHINDWITLLEFKPGIWTINASPSTTWNASADNNDDWTTP